MSRALKWPAVAFAVGCLLTAGVLTARAAMGAGSAAETAAAPAATNVLHACVHRVTGDMRNVAGPSACRRPERAISWNVQGPPGPRGEQGPPGEDGADGVSVTIRTLTIGDASCPHGGAELTAANGVAYACNGAPGAAGPAGPAGSLTGSATSPNGVFTFELNNAGIFLRGPKGTTFVTRQGNGESSSPFFGR